METARNLITNALLDLGVLADGETPTASEAVGGLRKLNNMLDAWNIERLMIYGAIQNVFTLAPDQGTYTLGISGNFNIPRPNEVMAAYLRDTASNPQADIPIYIQTNEEYADLPYKLEAQTYPYNIYINNTFPLSTVYLNPVPTSTQYKLVLWTSGIISNLDLDSQFTFPAGYAQTIEANLAIILAPSYGVEPSAVTVNLARTGKSNIKAQNFNINELRLPFYYPTTFDLKTGNW